MSKRNDSAIFGDSETIDQTPAVKSREIDKRYLPSVAGVDLMQALNYIALKDVSKDFIDNKYTASRLPYVQNSRPVIEEIAQDITSGVEKSLDKVKAIAEYVAEHLPWAGYYHLKEKKALPMDRALAEEELIASGYGWCNEQARLFCCLTQAVGVTSRIVFAGNNELGFGHVVAEALLPDAGWMMIDQTFGFLFLNEKTPVCAYEVYHNLVNRAYFFPIYEKLCRDLTDKLGRAIICVEFEMAVADDVLSGFKDLGYHNYFLL